MKVIVQIKFSSEKERLTKFGDFRYIVYMTSKKEEHGVMDRFMQLMSKELGVPPNRIHYQGRQGENYIFELD